MILALSLVSATSAFNDWSVPCFHGECAYDTSSTTMGSGTVQLVSPSSLRVSLKLNTSSFVLVILVRLPEKHDGHHPCRRMGHFGLRSQCFGPNHSLGLHERRRGGVRSSLRSWRASRQGRPSPRIRKSSISGKPTAYLFSFNKTVWRWTVRPDRPHEYSGGPEHTCSCQPENRPPRWRHSSSNLAGCRYQLVIHRYRGVSSSICNYLPCPRPHLCLLDAERFNSVSRGSTANSQLGTSTTGDYIPARTAKRGSSQHWLKWPRPPWH